METVDSHDNDASTESMRPQQELPYPYKNILSSGVRMLLSTRPLWVNLRGQLSLHDRNDAYGSRTKTRLVAHA